MTVSYLTTRPTSGPPYTTSVDATEDGVVGMVGAAHGEGAQRPELCLDLVGPRTRWLGLPQSLNGANTPERSWPTH